MEPPTNESAVAVLNTIETAEINAETSEKSIDLGYMSIAGGVWATSPYIDSDEDSDNEKPQLDPDEVIISETKVIIGFNYPLKDTFNFTFRSAKGFTRKEISEKIMAKYQDIYRKEDEAAGDPGNIPGMINRARSTGPYGIWGHHIGDLELHTLYIRENYKSEFSGPTGSRYYTLGIDS